MGEAIEKTTIWASESRELILFSKVIIRFRRSGLSFSVLYSVSRLRCLILVCPSLTRISGMHFEMAAVAKGENITPVRIVILKKNSQRITPLIYLNKHSFNKPTPAHYFFVETKRLRFSLYRIFLRQEITCNISILG